MKTEFIESLGEVTFIKRKKSKGITVKIEPYNKIKVSLPHYISYSMAKNYILKNILAIQKKATQLNRKIKPFDASINFQTKWHKLKLKQKDINHLEYSIVDHTILVSYPKDENVQNLQIQEFIREAIIETLRKEAKEYLPGKVEELAKKNNLKYNQLFIKNIKTQWGSCSYKNNINLNLHLMRLPNHLIDYVIYHELCHTVHKNHAPEFWQKLSSLVEGDINELRKELRNFSPQLYSV